MNLRYLAVILRVADVLEFDPERTPTVILNHRDIAPASVIYWWKDHHISIRQEGQRLLISSRPPTAKIHNAIDLTADEIDRELRLSRTLADEIHFDRCPGLAEALPHRWELTGALHRDIRPKDRSYEYIDGAFRPNTKRLLGLLSGVELYRTPFAAVRELLQNAFDAVKEQIAYERLSYKNPADPLLDQKLSELHFIELRLDSATDGLWLSCTDTGVGMTKAIIRDYLLVSGTGRRHDILNLERRCKESGFVLGRTGQFGIGVLSYFMLADHVSISTRRSQEAGDADGKGWDFETDGIGSFGQLREAARSRHGTVVKLHLQNSAITSEINGWFDNLVSYLRGNFVYLPCRVDIKSSILDTNSIAFHSGWAKDTSELAILIEKNVEQAIQGWQSGAREETPSHLLSSTTRKAQEEWDAHIQEVKGEVRKSVRWLEKEGDLPDKLGRFRIHLPFFELPDGNSLGFLRCLKADMPKQHHLLKIGKGFAFLPLRNASPQHMFAGWKGMRVNLRDRSHFDAIILEVDWFSSAAGTVAVNRNEFTLSDSGNQSLKWLAEQIDLLLTQFLTKNKNSIFAGLNNRLYGAALPAVRPSSWIYVTVPKNNADLRVIWKGVVFPAINSLPFIFSELPRASILWKRQPVSVLGALTGPTDSNHYDGLSWNSDYSVPDRIVEFQTFRFSLVPLWTKKSESPQRFPLKNTTAFPPTWRRLLAVTFSHYTNYGTSATFWNRDHPLAKIIDLESWKSCQEQFKESQDLLLRRDAILSDRKLAAAWIALLIIRREKDLWNGLWERDPNFLGTMWNTVFKNKSTSKTTSVAYWLEAASDTALHLIDSKNWQTRNAPYSHDLKGLRLLRSHMPNPGVDWTLKIRIEKGSHFDPYYWRALRHVLSKGAKRKAQQR